MWSHHHAQKEIYPCNLWIKPFIESFLNVKICEGDQIDLPVAPLPEPPQLMCTIYDVAHSEHIVTHCNTLEHTATHCNALRHTTTHCNALQHTATHCNTLQHTATHCNALQRTRSPLTGTWTARVTYDVTHFWHTATHRNTLQHTATHCYTSPRAQPRNNQTVWLAAFTGCKCAASGHDTLQHSATLCNTLQHSATHRNTPQHTATHCNTLQHTSLRAASEWSNCLANGFHGMQMRCFRASGRPLLILLSKFWRCARTKERQRRCKSLQDDT